MAPSTISRKEFIQQAGGIFQSPKNYEEWSGTDKWENFWSFFLDKDFGWVKSLYGDISVKTLRRHHRHSIEHIIPRSTLLELLTQRGAQTSVINGATSNPLNLAPSDRYLNKTRSNYSFDFEDDNVQAPFDIYLNPLARGTTGLDADSEWVVPCHSRGNIARAVLYMVTIYELDPYYQSQYQTLKQWHLNDPPTNWEHQYNKWVQRKFRICNPCLLWPVETFDWLMS